MFIIQEVEMFSRDSVKRLGDKSPMHAIQVELQKGYALSPVEAKVLAHRLQQLVDEQTGYTRSLGQIVYQAIDIDEPSGKPLDECRKVAVQLTLFDQADAEALAREGPVGLRQVRVCQQRLHLAGGLAAASASSTTHAISSILLRRRPPMRGRSLNALSSPPDLPTIASGCAAPFDSW
jgi:hypothetical protein